MKLENIDVEYAIYGMLFSLSNRIQTIGDKEFGDITLKQHFVLIGLSMFEKSPTLKEMGELIGCSYQNVKRMATQLESKGYINIIQDKDDKRKLLLVPTEKVKRVGDEKQEATINFMTNLFREISKDELEVTLSTLKKMDRNIGGIIE